MQCFMYARAGSAHDNHYAHPLDLLVVLDMNTRAVLDIQAHPLPPAIPALSTNYLAPLVHKERGTRSGTPSTSRQFCHFSSLCRAAVTLKASNVDTLLRGPPLRTLFSCIAPVPRAVNLAEAV